MNFMAAQWLPMSLAFLADLWGELGVIPPKPEMVAQMQGGQVSLDLPFKRLLKIPAAKEVLQRPPAGSAFIFCSRIPLLKGASLRQLVGFMPDAFPEELLRSIDAELARL